MLQTGHNHRRVLLGGGIQIVLDFDDGRHGIGDVAKELERDGTHVLGHAMQNKGGRGNQAVTTFFLHARQSRQEFVGHIFTQAHFTEAGAWDFQNFRFCQQVFMVDVVMADFETRHFDVMNLAQIVVQTFDFQPGGIWRHHAPGGEVVQRSAPQHSFFTTGVHRDITTDTAGIRRRRVAGEFQTGRGRCIHGAAGDHTGTTFDGSHLA